MNKEIVVRKYTDDTHIGALTAGDVVSVIKSSDGDFYHALMGDVAAWVQSNFAKADFSLTPGTALDTGGRLQYDGMADALAFVRADGETVHVLGEYVGFQAKLADTVVTGTPLYLTGAFDDYPKVGKASVQDNKHQVVGFATKAGSVGDVVHVLVLGVQYNVAARKAEETWGVGDVLWLGDGELTKIRPVDTDIRVECGRVLNDHILLHAHNESKDDEIIAARHSNTNDVTYETMGGRLDVVDTRVNNIIEGQDIDPNKDIEVLDARHSNVSDITYPTVGIRLDNTDGRVDNILQGQDIDPNKDIEVLDARHSNTSNVRYMSIGNRMDTLEAVYGEVGHIYGARMNRTTGIVEYTDDAVGMTYRQQINVVGQKSDFSSVYPWSEIKTVKVDQHGNILTTIDNPNFVSTEGDIMVKIPVFWSRKFVETIDGHEHEWYQVSDVPRTGWKAQGFTKPDGRIMPYALWGACDTSNDGNTPHSWADAPPTVNKALYNTTNGFQTQALAKSNQVVWSNIHVDAYEAIWTLIFVETGGHVLSGTNALGFDVKKTIGQGINSLGVYDASYTCTVDTTNDNIIIISKSYSSRIFEGMYVNVGTSSTSSSVVMYRKVLSIEEYDDDNDVVTVDGAPFSTAVGNVISAWGQPVPIEQIMALGNESGYVLQFDSTVKSHVCYRGIWDLWGNVYQWLAGLYRYDLEFWICHDPAKMNVGDPREASGWANTKHGPNLSNGYLKERYFHQDEFGSVGLPQAVGAGDSTWYAAYCYYFNDVYMGLQAVLCGGHWYNGSDVGFSWAGRTAPSYTSLNWGGRLFLL